MINIQPLVFGIGDKMKRTIGDFLLALVISSISFHGAGGVLRWASWAAESQGPISQEFKAQVVPSHSGENSPKPSTPGKKPMAPNLPPPGIDPEIVHEPPPNPNPEAVIPPPKVDPEMAVKPQTLPSYPDFPFGKPGEPEEIDPKGLQQDTAP